MMAHKNHCENQLCLLSSQQLADVERQLPQSTSSTTEAKRRPRERRKICKPPLSEAGMVQETLPGLTWPK